jgi:hypothetical protein
VPLRFPLSKILNWMDALSELDAHQEVYDLVCRLDTEQIPFPPERVIAWGMRGIYARGNKKWGSLMLIRPACREHPALNLREIGTVAAIAAEGGDHAAFRLLLILILATRKLRPESRRYRALEEDIVQMLIDSMRSEDQFLTEYLLVMLKRRLPEDRFEAIYREYSDYRAAKEKELLQAAATRRQREEEALQRRS